MNKLKTFRSSKQCSLTSLRTLFYQILCGEQQCRVSAPGLDVCGVAQYSYLLLEQERSRSQRRRRQCGEGERCRYSRLRWQQSRSRSRYPPRQYSLQQTNIHLNPILLLSMSQWPTLVAIQLYSRNVILTCSPEHGI